MLTSTKCYNLSRDISITGCRENRVLANFFFRTNKTGDKNRDSERERDKSFATAEQSSTCNFLFFSLDLFQS
jgi:hypothetical protein